MEAMESLDPSIICTPLGPIIEYPALPPSVSAPSWTAPPIAEQDDSWGMSP